MLVDPVTSGLLQLLNCCSMKAATDPTLESGDGCVLIGLYLQKEAANPRNQIIKTPKQVSVVREDISGPSSMYPSFPHLECSLYTSVTYIGLAKKFVWLL